MQLGESNKIIMKRPTVLIIETTMNETENFLETLRTMIKKITIKNIKHDELEAERLEMCKSVEFYLKNCVALSLENILIATVGLICGPVLNIVKMVMFIRKRSPNHVYTFKLIQRNFLSIFNPAFFDIFK